jgi:hypothetical protein
MSAARRSALRSKRVQRGRISVVVEQSGRPATASIVSPIWLTTVLDMFVHTGHTLHTPFQILISE